MPITSSDLPPALLELRLAFNRAGLAVKAYSDLLPSGLAGAATITDDQRTELARLRKVQADLAVKLSGDPWLAAAPNPAEARLALQAAALAILNPPAPPSPEDDGSEEDPAADPAAGHQA